MAILAPAVDLRDVTKSYDEGGRVRVVLDRITATLLQGEVTVVVGRSGSGKSTFLNLIGGIDVPSSGAVWVGGARIERLCERERTLFRRRRIGFVFQSFNLVPTLTAIENLLLPLELNGWEATTAEARALGIWMSSGSPTGPGRSPTTYPVGSSSASR